MFLISLSHSPSIWEGLLRYRAVNKVFEAASVITFPVSTALVNWSLSYPPIIAEGAFPINLSFKSEIFLL